MSAQEQATAESYERATRNVISATRSVGYPLNPDKIKTNARQLRNKTVLITGAGSGFGAKYAKDAASYGAKVAISDLDVKAARKVALEISNAGGVVSVFPQSCDVTRWEQQVAFFKHTRKTLGHIDVVVCNAGVGEIGQWNEDHLDSNGDPLPPPDLPLKVNLIGASYTARLAFFHMRQNRSKGKKHIVLIGSMASHAAIPGGPNYSMAKHGILGLFRSIYWDGQVEGVNVNIVCPFFCDTRIIEPHVRFALFGLPLVDIEHVVLAMLESSSDPDFAGNTISVDAQGMLCLPFEWQAAGEDGYYAEFGKRAVYALSAQGMVRDTVNIVRHLARVSRQTVKGRVASLGVLASAYLLIKSLRRPKAP